MSSVATAGTRWVHVLAFSSEDSIIFIPFLKNGCKVTSFFGYIKIFL